jgi:hypothetical protein
MPLHDTLWKRLLQILFASVLRFLAPSLAGGTFSFLDKELFPEGIRGEGREVDVLGRVCPPAGGTVLVHLEVEARFREESVRRLRQYYHLLEARHGEPVFSVLIALRGGPRGLVQVTREDQVAGQRRLFELTVIGLGGCDAEELLASPEPIAWAFAALARCPSRERPARKLACMDRIQAAKLPTDEDRVLVNAVETYIQLNAEQEAEYDRLKSRKEGRAMRLREMTWEDRMIELGRREGRAQEKQALAARMERLREEKRRVLAEAKVRADRMKEQGREQGAIEGVRHMLKRQLHLRFRELAPAVAAKIDRIRSVERLTRLADKVLVARSLAEMGLGDGLR